MRYEELIERALKGRSVNKAAKDWGVPQRSLDNYSKGIRLPGFELAMKIATDAGVSLEDAFRVFADYERDIKSRSLVEKISANFEVLVSHLRPRQYYLSTR
jgi:hypothetical protein